MSVVTLKQDSKIVSVLDKNINESWDLPDTDRSLDQKNIGEYVSKLEPKYSSVVKHLLDTTVYIKFKDFKSNLIKSFITFASSIGSNPVYLLWETNKFGSGNWLVQVLWPLIKKYKINIKGVITENDDKIPESKLDVLIIDDAIYSGNHIIGLVDSWTFNVAVKQTKKESPDQKEFLQDHMIKLHIIAPYVNTIGVQTVKKGIRSITGISDTTIYSTVEFKPYILDNTIAEMFDVEVPRIVSNIYFDHKVANNFGSFPQIYLDGIIPGGNNFGSLMKEVPSRAMIEKLALTFK